MANVPISALPASSTPLAGTELVPIVQSGNTAQVSVDNLTSGRAISASGATVTGLTADQAVFTDANKALVSVAVTGTGSVVRATSPTLVTPTLGAATATSINKVFVTAPAASATLTIANGKTLTANNSLVLAGTDSTTMTFPPASAEIGYLGVPVNSQTAPYTLVLADAGKSIVHPITDNNARTFTIPANSSVAFPIGTTITFINMINTVTIAITTDTMYLAGAGTTGSRTLAAYGMATAVKITSTSWIISGNGLT